MVQADCFRGFIFKLILVSIVCFNIYPLNRISFSYFCSLEINSEMTNTPSMRTMKKKKIIANKMELNHVTMNKCEIQVALIYIKSYLYALYSQYLLRSI